MKKREASILLKNQFDFLIRDYGFTLQNVESHDYALYAEFFSSQVQIYFSFEFRESVPNIQLSLIGALNSKMRPGLYTLIDLYKDPRFQLQSFYLDEVLSFMDLTPYRLHFKSVKTIQDSIEISANLVKMYAVKLVEGDKTFYLNIDEWFKKQIELNRDKKQC